MGWETFDFVYREEMVYRGGWLNYIGGGKFGGFFIILIFRVKEFF